MESVTAATMVEGPRTANVVRWWTCATYDFVIETIVMGLLCLFGFVGNTLSIVCLWRDSSKTATPFLLISLDIADTVFLATVTVLRVVQSAASYAGWQASFATMANVVKYVYPVALIAMTSTVYLTLLVTFNRYVSVCRPYDVRTLCAPLHARVHVVMVTFFSILYNVPRFFEFDVIDVPPSSMFAHNVTSGARGSALVTQILVSSSLSQNRVYQIIYVNTLYFIVMFLVPLTVLIFLNVQLIRELRLVRKRREDLLGVTRRRASSLKMGAGVGVVKGGGATNSEEDFTLTLIVVVVVFVVCQTPALVTQTLLSALPDNRKSCPYAFFYYERLSDLLVVVNSAVNFVVYSFCSRQFRQILFDLCGFSGERYTIGRSRTQSKDSTVTIGHHTRLLSVSAVTSSTSPLSTNRNSCVDLLSTNKHLDTPKRRGLEQLRQKTTNSLTVSTYSLTNASSSNLSCEMTQCSVSFADTCRPHAINNLGDDLDDLAASDLLVPKLMLNSSKCTVDKYDTFASSSPPDHDLESRTTAVALFTQTTAPESWL